MEIGEFISLYLLKHDLSIRQFGRMSGISHAYIANIVNGKTSRGNKPAISLKKIEQIATAMGMDVNSFLRAVDVDIDLSQPYEDDCEAELQMLKEREDLKALIRAAYNRTPEQVQKLVELLGTIS